ncbi:hypothetical protein VDH22_03205, partial [Xanthomonas campestris pv. raphani]|uniref:hypothetical protein n=2 Tax=Xanthomonas campestris TaxID=339 RepID=UPI002B238F56
EEAPLSERSEFGRRAARGEEHRAPVQLHRTGSRRANTVLVTFAKTKVTRATGAEASAWLCLSFRLRSPRPKASRAPQSRVAEEAPLSERSEFGRRAARGEEHRAPVRLHRTGSRRASAVLVTFAKTKVTCATGAEAFASAFA